MQVRSYFDEDAMDNDVVRALQLRGVEVITAQDSGLINSPDEQHLKYAAANERVLYSFIMRESFSRSSNGIASESRCAA